MENGRVHEPTCRSIRGDSPLAGKERSIAYVGFVTVPFAVEDALSPVCTSPKC